ncbi:MAG TPA: CPBP family intramembrane glutamic endopeptidase [Candidatus Dormibacteraeota bacterium]|nr:CPBP family intramembrane glutamic endopeptidase [Candidatus Dormibacteraeota bacterium]
MRTSSRNGPDGAAPPGRAGSPHLIFTRPSDSLAWIRIDLAQRLLPFATMITAVWLAARPTWLGIAPGRLPAQLGFGLAGGAGGFAAACLLQRLLAPVRGSLRVPDGPADAILQTAYYLLNAPIEEAVFRGLIQGGLGALIGTAPGMAAGVAGYVLYHRLGGWAWIDVAATALVGVPAALAFHFLPGAPSLLGVSLLHFGATCGFLGPGPGLLRRIDALPGPGAKAGSRRNLP